MTHIELIAKVVSEWLKAGAKPDRAFHWAVRRYNLSPDETKQLRELVEKNLWEATADGPVALPGDLS